MNTKLKNLEPNRFGIFLWRANVIIAVVLWLIPNLLYVTGAFALLLGALHFFFPLLFDFRGALSQKGAPLKPFPLVVTQYQTTRQDIRGLIWVMNHAASFTILTMGLLDVTWTVWLRSSFGAWIAVWMAMFWFLRAGSQLYMGKRRGDWLILAGFATIGIIHLLLLSV